MLNMFRRILYRAAWPLLRIYWFVARPHPRGAKCIVSCQGKLLMIRNTYGRQRWTFPGGRIEQGESPAAAAKREVAEEVGIAVSGLEAIGDFEVKKDFKIDHTYCFKAESATRELIIDRGEIREAAWFDPDHLPQPLSPVADQMLQLWRKV